MNFLYPAFLIGALAIAVPIVLHLLRRDVAPQVPFSAVRLLRRSPIERSRRRRLRDLLLLAARVIAILLLATAFARPYRSNAAAGPDVRIVAVDRSFSMGAPGRFAAALEAARAAIDEASPGERVAVIVFDDRADVVAPAGSAADARAALAGLTPGFGATRFGPAIGKAVEAAEGQRARLVIVTDLQRAGWEDEQRAAVPSGFEVDVRDIGEAPPNAAITALRVEARRVVATVRNTGHGPFSGYARAMVSGGPGDDRASAAREAGRTNVTVPARDSADVAIPLPDARGESVSVAIDDPSGFPADNVRYAVLAEQPGTRVLIVTGAERGQAGFYLSRALESVTGDGAFDLHEMTGPSLSSMPAEELGRAAAAVLLSTRRLDRRGREALVAFVRGGGGLLVAASPEVDPSVLASVMPWPDVAGDERADGPVVLSATDLRHPIFQPFGALAANLGQVSVDRAWRVRAPGWDVAARFSDGSPAVIERREGQGRIVLFTSDLDRQWNDFPLHPAFVPFAVEAVRHVAGSREWKREYFVAEAPAGARPEPGVYAIERAGRRVAVNVDPREGRTERLTPEEFGRMLDRVEAGPLASGPPDEARTRRSEATQGLWRYGLILMLAALVAESFIGRPS
jgi:hypothetical protein